MSEQTTLTPAKAAELVGVEVYTVRRWCDWHAAHLSPGASPGAGALRRLTMRDIEVLKTVRDLRAQGLTTATINEQLEGLTFPEIEPGGWPDGTPTNTNAVEPVPASQEGPGVGQLPAVVHNDLQLKLDRLERSVVHIEAEMRPRWWWFAVGLGAGLGLAVVFELAALVASRGR